MTQLPKGSIYCCGTFEEQSQYLSYEKTVVLTTFTFQLLLTGIFLPWPEELYFRGYLMPRISRYGKWTPLMGGMLFALYHLWQPFSFMIVFLLGSVLAFMMWWQRDIRLAVSLRILANSLTRVALLLASVSM